MYQVRGKCFNQLKNWQKCALGYFLQPQGGIFLYFAFFQFYGCRNAQKQRFWAKYSDFYPKIALSAHFGSRKIVKKQNIQKSLFEIVANTLRYIFAHFQVNWSIFHRIMLTFPSILFFKIFAVSAKKLRFFGQNSANFRQKFSKFWKSIKTI